MAAEAAAAAEAMESLPGQVVAVHTEGMDELAAYSTMSCSCFGMAHSAGRQQRVGWHVEGLLLSLQAAADGGGKKTQTIKPNQFPGPRPGKW